MNVVADILWLIASAGWFLWYPSSFYRMLKTRDATNQSVFSWVSYAASDFIAATAGLFWQQWIMAGSLYCHFIFNTIYLILVLKFKKKEVE
jgi:hypothetical protein